MLGKLVYSLEILPFLYSCHVTQYSRVVQHKDSGARLGSNLRSSISYLMLFDKLFNLSVLGFIICQIYSTYLVRLLGKVMEQKGGKGLEQHGAHSTYILVLALTFFSPKHFACTFGRRGSAITRAQPSDAMFYTISPSKLFEIQNFHCCHRSSYSKP